MTAYQLPPRPDIVPPRTSACWASRKGHAVYQLSDGQLRFRMESMLRSGAELPAVFWTCQDELKGRSEGRLIRGEL